MKVYIVTAGEYSGYRIEKVFFNREKARFYQMINFPNDGNVEEYEINDDVISDEQRNRFIKVEYDVRDGSIGAVKVCSADKETNQIKLDWSTPVYVFTLRIGAGRLYSNIIRYGRGSKMLLKIAQDRLAQHLYERGTSREELIELARQRCYDKWGFYPYEHIAQTSMPTTYEIPVDPVAEEVNNRLHVLIDSCQNLPESIDEFYKQVKEEMKVQKDDTESNSE